VRTTSTNCHESGLVMIMVVVRGPPTAVGAVGHGVAAGVLREPGVDLVLVLHLGVDVVVGVGVDVGVGVLVDVGGAVGWLEQTLGGTGRVPALALLSDQPVSPLSQSARLGAVLELVVVAGDGEALVDGGRGVDIVNGLVRIKHHAVIILDVSAIMPSSYSLPAEDQQNSGDSEEEDRGEAEDQNGGNLILNISTLVSKDSICGEICEVTGGVCGVTR